MTNQEYRNTTTRRRLLGVATVGLGAAIGGVLTTPVAAYLLAPTTQEATFHPVSLGPVRSFTSETGFAPAVPQFANLPFASRRGCGDRENEGGGNDTRQGFHRLSPLCPWRYPTAINWLG